MWECPDKACGHRMTENSRISEFLGNKHKHSAAAGVWGGKEKLTLDLSVCFSSVHTHSSVLSPALSKSIFSFHVFRLGVDFFLLPGARGGNATL